MNRYFTLGALATVLLITVVTSSFAQTVTVVNSASFEINAPRGALLTFYINPGITDETQAFSYPWPDQTSGGAWIRIDNCQSGQSKKLPILYVGPDGFGGNQFNVYLPNNIGSEPFGTCDAGGASNFTFQPKSGFGSAFTRSINTNNYSPGIFTANSSGTGTPAGFHLRATDGFLTPLTTCANTPSDCPVSTSGQMNYLILFTTGNEQNSCGGSGFPSCVGSVVNFKLNGVTQTLEFNGYAGFLGQEQANVRLASGTQAGDYTLTMSLPNAPQQQLPIRLGAAK